MNASAANTKKRAPRIKNPNLRFGRLFPWTKEEEALLGTGPDSEVAEKLNRTAGAVEIRRINLKIPIFGRARQPFRSAREFPWTKDEDALLGKSRDRDVAERLNRTLGAVRDRRRLLGIAAVGQAPQAFYRQREPRDGYAHLFATKSNREIHALLGWSYKRIRSRRRQLAAGAGRRRYPNWSLEEDQLLGTKPDAVLARQFGRTVSAVTARRCVKRIRLTKKWRPEDEKILGARPDRQTGLLLGRSPANIYWRRKMLGIPAKAKPRAWTQEETALLGVKPDAELAKLFGRTVGAVAALRMQLGRTKMDARVNVVKVAGHVAAVGVPTTKNAGKGARYVTWTPEEDALLGTLSDAEVAKKLGCSIMRVFRRRSLLGVKNKNPMRRKWTQEEIALLGTKSDREVGLLIGKSVGNVRFKRIELGIPFKNEHYEAWKPEELALLGKLPDEEVAARTRHSLSSVRQARHKRHIQGTRTTAPRWSPEEDAVLGTASDAEIAARLNRTIKAVTHRRVIKGIPAWHSSCHG
ncbi:MAG TPA: hypothetical protein VMF08_01780 [Candidatus Sulfotelmatobacter sp.]|nr:hypothetical protein [Candidatus Sulfotelmatobacter sp.]